MTSCRSRSLSSRTSSFFLFDLPRLTETRLADDLTLPLLIFSSSSPSLPHPLCPTSSLQPQSKTYAISRSSFSPFWLGSFFRFQLCPTFPPTYLPWSVRRFDGLSIHEPAVAPRCRSCYQFGRCIGRVGSRFRVASAASKSETSPKRRVRASVSLLSKRAEEQRSRKRKRHRPTCKHQPLSS